MVDDDLYVVAAEAFADSCIEQAGRAGHASGLPSREYLVNRALNRPQLRAAINAVLEAERDRAEVYEEWALFATGRGGGLTVITNASDDLDDHQWVVEALASDWPEYRSMEPRRRTVSTVTSEWEPATP